MSRRPLPHNRRSPCPHHTVRLTIYNLTMLILGIETFVR